MIQKNFRAVVGCIDGAGFMRSMVTFFEQRRILNYQGPQLHNMRWKGNIRELSLGSRQSANRYQSYTQLLTSIEDQ